MTHNHYQPIGDYIELVDERNKDLSVELLLGLTVNKEFIPSVANTVGANMKNYKIIKKDQFACSTMQVRRDKKMPVALLKDFDEAIISQAYPVFQVIDENELLPEYLMMWFSRTEFDREACFYAVGGVRGSLEWEDFENMKLPVPHIDTQREIVAEYNTVVNRIKLNEQLNQKLEETAQALYKHWFVDFEFPYSPPVEGCPTDGVVAFDATPDGVVAFDETSNIESNTPRKQDDTFKHLRILYPLVKPQTDSDHPKENVIRNTKNYKALPFNPKLKERAKELRKAGNLSEVLFWQKVYKGKFKGLDFDRQKIIGNYIVDFFCPNINVVIEIDGSSHDDKKEYDDKRDEYLQNLGLTIIHILDIDVKQNLDTIMAELNAHPAMKISAVSDHPVLRTPLQRRGMGYKSSGGKMVYNAELDKEIPEGWEVYHLSDIGKIKGGKRMPNGESLIRFPNEHPYIKVADMVVGKFIRLNDNIEYVPKEIQPKIRKYIVLKNDVIISIVGTIGIVNIIEDSLNNANLTENCVKITNLQKISPSFLYHYFESSIGQKEIKTRNVGAVQAKLPIYNIETIPILIGNDDIMQKFEYSMSKLDKKYKVTEEEQVYLERLKNLLLSKMARVEEEVEVA